VPACGETYNPWRVFRGSFIPNAILSCTGISPTSKLVFGRLCQYAGENGIAYPSYSALAREVGIERRQAMRAVRELEDFGLIRSIRRTREDGGFSSNTYEFLWHGVFNGMLPAPPGDTDDTRAGDMDDTTPWCQKGHHLVSDMTPKEIHRRESVYEETTTGEVRSLLSGPFTAVSDQDLATLSRRHGRERLKLAADIASETWRRDGIPIRNPSRYLQALCAELVVPGWYLPRGEPWESLAHAREAGVKAAAEEARRQEREAALHLARDKIWESLVEEERQRYRHDVREGSPFGASLKPVVIDIIAKSRAYADSTGAGEASPTCPGDSRQRPVC
jgi:hypothetical protein